MMSSFRQLTVGSCSRPAIDSEQCQPVTAAAAAAAGGAGQFLFVDSCLSYLFIDCLSNAIVTCEIKLFQNYLSLC